MHFTRLLSLPLAPGFSGLAPAPFRRVVGLGQGATDADGVQDSGALARLGGDLSEHDAITRDALRQEVPDPRHWRG